MDTKVIYHDNCPDGFAACWAAWKSLGYHDIHGNKIEYLPYSYGMAPPDLNDCFIYIVDFSFLREALLTLLDKNNKIVLLDHHKTAEKDLENLSHPNLEVVFDMNRSGAMITWNYFFKDEPNWMIEYVQDRDLWVHKLASTLEINSYLQSLPHDFEVYSKVFESGGENTLIAGSGALSWCRYYIDSTKKHSYITNFLGYDVPIVNAPYTSISEVVGELSEGHEFAVGWHLRKNGLVVYSLRSKNGFDVSEIAKSMGGGGHKAAAGFTSKLFPWELKPLPHE